MPFIDCLLQAFLIYQMDHYTHLMENYSLEEIEFRYVTILELLLILLNRSVMSKDLFGKIKNTGFLTLYTSLEFDIRLRNMYLELINVFNRLVSSKLKVDGVTPKEVDEFVVCYGIVDFVMQVFKATFRRKSLLFSTAAGFFRLASLYDRAEIIAATVV